MQRIIMKKKDKQDLLYNVKLSEICLNNPLFVCELYGSQNSTTQIASSLKQHNL